MVYMGIIRLSVLFKEDRYQQDCTMDYNWLTIMEISSKNLILRKSGLKS